MGSGNFVTPFKNFVKDTPYVYPVNWLALSEPVGEQGIYIVSDESSYVGFRVALVGGGTYSIDWGDGNTTTETSGTIAAHVYIKGSGYDSGAGYTTFKVIITASGNPLSSIKVDDPSAYLIDQNRIWLRAAVVRSASITDMSNAFQYCYGLEYVRIVLTGYEISYAYVCDTCNNLRYFEFPQSIPGDGSGWVTTMQLAFSGCYSLTDVVLPKTLTRKVVSNYISLQQAFRNCRGLKYVYLPDNVKSSVSSNMFDGCYSLIAVRFPTSGYFGSMSGMFSQCTCLKFFNMPNQEAGSAITSWEKMFYYCTSLEYVNFLGSTYNGMTTINQMFNSCQSIRSIALPNLPSMTIITSAFGGCQSLKSATFGTTGTLAGNAQFVFQTCYSLESVTLPSMPGVNNISYMFENCSKLKTVVFPDVSMNSVTSIANCFSGCYILESITLPTSMTACTSYSYFLSFCTRIRSITLPATVSSNAIDFSYAFQGTRALQTIVFPVSIANISTFGYAFYNAYNLKTLTNFNTIGALGIQTNMASAFMSTDLLTTIIISGSLSAFSVEGLSNTGKFLKTASIRLTSQSSTFDGGSPQVSVKYTEMSASALEILFLDLPRNLAKTVAVTGSAGARSNYFTKTLGHTSESTTVTCANTSSLVVGMEVSGTNSPQTTTQVVTFQQAGSTVTKANHGIANGTRISFPTITSTTGILIYTIYYVINATQNTFQVSDTVGGNALTLTNDGSGTMLVSTTIITINTNVSIIISSPSTGTGSASNVCNTLLVSKATLKGWTVTY